MEIRPNSSVIGRAQKEPARHKILFYDLFEYIGIFYARVRAYDKVPSDSNFIDTDAEINSADMGAADNLKNEWPIYRCRVIHHLEFIIQQ